ncbi:UPF0554 protein C2orf43 homolog [Nesidiocoris tenuis]|uniref:Lipid droplet-associated hydrolase n=1 Tax=Nesidiocoris tenuis TaxID=355587 RepID=A0ABN7APY6_9HEMI|nr:UPF0554 protein C2orf43 homolog [Nesidiocoris tenuis]
MVSRFQSGFEKWLVLNEVPSCLQTFGERDDDSSQPDTVILVVSGNPGISDFYVKFMKSLHQKCNGLPVWVIGHAGHEYHPESPSLDKRPELFNMAGQVKHKMDFIKNHIPRDKKLILVGHSMGAKICVELMKHDWINSRVKQAHLMYPCLEHTSQTRNGSLFMRSGTRFFSIVNFITRVLSFMPEFVQLHFVRWGLKRRFRMSEFEDNLVHSAMKLIRPEVVKQAVSLAVDVLNKVQDLDDEVYQRDGSKIVAYYAQTDGWSPVEHYENLKTRHPNVRAFLMDSKFEHTFTARTSDEMAEEVARNIRELDGIDSEGVNVGEIDADVGETEK